MKRIANHSTEKWHFASTWNFSLAVERLFLDMVPTEAATQSEKLRSDRAIELATMIQDCVVNDSPPTERAKLRARYPQVETLVDVLRRAKAPLDAATQVHALLWLRLAVTNGFRLSPTVIRKFSRWASKAKGAQLKCETPPVTKPGIVISKKTSALRSNPAPSPPRDTFSIDEVVLGGALVDDHLVFRRKWTLVTAKARSRLPQLERVKASCGATLVGLLSETLAMMAATPKHAMLKKQRGAAKFISSAKRADLAVALKAMNTKLKDYGDSNIEKALSALVECPKGKRGGRSG